MCPTHVGPFKSPHAALAAPLWLCISASHVVITDLCLISFSTALVQIMRMCLWWHIIAKGLCHGRLMLEGTKSKLQSSPCYAAL